MSEWNPKYETREDETNNKPERENRIHAVEKIAFDCITDAIRPEVAEMEPQERRKYCTDVAAEYSRLCGNRTGKFFNAFAGARDSKETDEKELGRKIMEKFNPHYRPKEK